MKEGILYVATGQRFVAEASRSAARVRELMPRIRMALASDLEGPRELFDHYLPIREPKFNFSDKIAPLLATPFEKTVFLDSDTWLCEPVPEMFSILDRHDIAMAHAPMRFTAASSVPATFPECNSGVIAYTLNDRTQSLLELWNKLYEQRLTATGVVDDQPSLRDALWQSDASFAVLPPEYNFRFIMPAFAGRGRVKIMHGRHNDYRSLEKTINKSGSPRVFLPRFGAWNDKTFQILTTLGGCFVKLISPIALGSKCLRAAIDGFKARKKTWK